MADYHAQLVAYITKYKDQFPLDVLRGHLVKHNFPADQIEKAIAAVIPSPPTPAPPPKPPTPPANLQTNPYPQQPAPPAQPIQPQQQPAPQPAPQPRPEAESHPQPAVQQPAPAQAPAGDMAAPKPKNRDFILVVDDDPNVRELLVDYLKEGGYRVSSASDGLQAVINAEGMNLQLILSDIEMPGFGSGVEAFKNLRESPFVPKDLPVIFITGMPPEDAKKIVPLEDPAVRLMHKPIDFGLLNKYIDELVKK